MKRLDHLFDDKAVLISFKDDKFGLDDDDKMVVWINPN